MQKTDVNMYCEERVSNIFHEDRMFSNKIEKT